MVFFITRNSQQTRNWTLWGVGPAIFLGSQETYSMRPTHIYIDLVFILDDKNLDLVFIIYDKNLDLVFILNDKKPWFGFFFSMMKTSIQF